MKQLAILCMIALLGCNGGDKDTAWELIEPPKPYTKLACYTARMKLDDNAEEWTEYTVGICIPTDSAELPEVPPSGHWEWTVSNDALYPIDRNHPAFRQGRTRHYPGGA